MALGGLLKPCYLFAPRTLLHRVRTALSAEECGFETVRLPWGASLEVNAQEGIGRELFRQRIFDIAVSEAAWRLLRPGDTAVDVGANVGYMSSLFAARVGPRGRVESFEPHPRIFARLRQNLHGAGAKESPACIALHDCALGARDGRAQLIEPQIFALNQGASTVAPWDQLAAASPGAEGFEVRMSRYDSTIGDRDVMLLKIDVEGFEGEVLAGAARALAARRIRHVIYEAHDCERSDLHGALTRYGYSLFGVGHDLFGPRLSPGIAPPRLDRAWESPSYLASLDPQAAVAALRPRGWQVLRAC